MGFNVTANTQKEGSQRKDVDFNAMQSEIIAAAKTQDKPRSLVGIITGVIDLGEQKRPDSEEEWKGTEEQERQEIANNPKVYFKNKQGKRWKCRPQRDCQQVAINVDFPQIIVDKAKYFSGNSDPKPLRLILNGETSLWMTTGVEADKKVRVLQKGFSLTETRNDDGSWSFDKKNTLYKLADATGLVVDGKFKPNQIDQLVGKAAQFQVRIYNKKGTDGKSYYTEEIKLQGLIPEGLPTPEFDSNLLHLIQFTQKNNEDHVKQLRQSVINTIKRANNFSGSVLESQLVAAGRVDTQHAPSKQSDSPEQRSKPSLDVQQSDFDDDIPF